MSQWRTWSQKLHQKAEVDFFIYLINYLIIFTTHTMIFIDPTVGKCKSYSGSTVLRENIK